VTDPENAETVFSRRERRRLPCHVLSCSVLLCPVLPCSVLSCSVLSCSALLPAGAEGQLHDINATLAVIKSAYEGRKIALSEITDDWTAYNNHDDEAKA
jgi:hypothetical protein